MLFANIKNKLGNVFYGWWIIAAGVVLCNFGYGAWYYSFGAFFNPISSEFGWPRATTSIAFSFSRVEGGFEGIVTGPLVDRFGPRFMVRVAFTMAALGFFLMYFINSFWMFIISYSLLLSLGMNAGLYMPLQTAAAKWFNEKRGLALGFLTAGAAIGGSILLPVTAWLITDYGWRKTVVILGIVALILGWAMSFILKPHGPEYYGLHTDGKKIEPAKDISKSASGHVVEKNAGVVEGLSLREALKTRAFWIMSLAFLLSHITLSGLVVHQIPFLEDMGISKVVAATALGTLTLISAPGRLFGGWLADKWGQNQKYLYAVANIVMAIGLFILSKATSMSWVWVFVAIYGPAVGLRITLEPVMRATYFGRKSFGTIFGFMNVFAQVGSFIGPFMAGWIFDTTQSYVSAFFGFAVLTIIAAIVVLFLKSPTALANRR